MDIMHVNGSKMKLGTLRRKERIGDEITEIERGN